MVHVIDEIWNESLLLTEKIYKIRLQLRRRKNPVENDSRNSFLLYAFLMLKYFLYYQFLYYKVIEFLLLTLDYYL